MSYNPPVETMIATLNAVAGLERLPGAAELDADTIAAILEEAAKLARDVLAPLNPVGDRAGGCRLQDGAVITPPGFREAYARYRDGGWNAVPFAVEHGGQGLPWALAFAVQEMWQGANMAFGLCPLLNQAAVEAIASHGTDEQKERYLEKLVSGEWTGTMNLTEPQAGSDLSAIRTRAEPQGDGTYRITGQKIFITYGEHDFADNIIHTVLARLPDAPQGVKGISMFIVPKILPDGTRNDVKCVGLEHKLGIHASPTCTMQYGDEGGAVGYLIGREHEGLKYMFTMMNNARLSVGLQGVAIAEAALQKAVAYAQDRVQGRDIQTGADRVAIINHPDVQRMIMTMRAKVVAARALAYHAAGLADLAMTGDGPGDRMAAALVDLLTPVVKAWCTDLAVEVTSTALQVHGGMGFIEETGIAQLYRDARILPIYEGTNGIQSADLIFRKLARDNGETLRLWLAGAPDHPAVATLNRATDHMLARIAGGDMAAAAFVGVPYLNALGIVSGAIMLDRLARQGDAEMVALQSFYTTHILPHAGAWAEGVCAI